MKAGVLRTSSLVVVVLCFRNLIEIHSAVHSSVAMWRLTARGWVAEFWLWFTHVTILTVYCFNYGLPGELNVKAQNTIKEGYNFNFVLFYCSLTEGMHLNPVLLFIWGRLYSVLYHVPVHMWQCLYECAYIVVCVYVGVGVGVVVLISVRHFVIQSVWKVP